MRKNTIRLIAAATLVMMALCGCSAVVSDPVVAKVGDREISYSDFYNMYAQYAQYGMIDTTSVESITAAKEVIMETLVNSVVPVAKAYADGVTLNEEELAAAVREAENMADYYLLNYKDTSIEDVEERNAAAIKAFNEDYKAAGITYDSMLEDLTAQYTDSAMGDKVVNELYSTIPEPTEEELQATYEEELAADQARYAENPSLYYNDDMYFGYYGELRPLAAPEGLFYVKHILIKNEENADEEDKGRDYKALAEEVLAKVNAGEDFEALIAEYNEDAGMDSYENGYIIGTSFEGIYDEAFQNAANELLKTGDTTGLVEGSYGIHIIRRVGDVSTEPVPFEDVKEEIKTLILDSLKDEMYTAKVAEWKEGLEIVTYDKRVQYVGVNQ